MQHSSPDHRVALAGWVDVDVSAKGAEEATNAGKLMHAANVSHHLKYCQPASNLTTWVHQVASSGVDVAFTSYQKRAIKTLNLALEVISAALPDGLLAPMVP